MYLGPITCLYGTFLRTLICIAIYMGLSYVPQTRMAIWVHLMYSAQIIAPISQGLTQTTPLHIRWTHILNYGIILCVLMISQGLTRHTPMYITWTHLKATIYTQPWSIFTSHNNERATPMYIRWNHIKGTLYTCTMDTMLWSFFYVTQAKTNVCESLHINDCESQNAFND